MCLQRTERYSSYPVYHSVYDTFEVVDRFYDPGFRRLRAVAQVRGGLVFLLADSQLLPLDVNQYAASLRKYAVSISQLAQRHPKDMDTFKVSFGENGLPQRCEHRPDDGDAGSALMFQILCFLLWRISPWPPGISPNVCKRWTDESKTETLHLPEAPPQAPLWTWGQTPG